MDSQVMVSVICNAYNHEEYIKDALESFVMQKTNFKFEILVHDDASTDKTADIIREYEKKYPELIKPIYQTENQYSKKQGIVSKIQYSRAVGKYIAICEGDDYLTDPYKLQKQFDAMEAHPDIDMCTHAAFGINARTNKKKLIAPAKNNCVLSLADVILGGGGYVATNSLFFRKSLNDNMPEFRSFLKLDYTLQIHGAIRGGMLYLRDNMSVYRVMAKNSWTSKMKANKDAYKKHIEKVYKMFELLDEHLDYKYSDVLKQKYINDDFEEMYQNGDVCSAKKEPYLELYKKMSIKRKIKMRLNYLVKKVR